VPSDMLPLLQDFIDVFSLPSGLPAHRPIEHTIDLILGTSLPNAPSYYLAPHDSAEIEYQIYQLLESGHIQPSSSPCTSPTFITIKKY